ncbi:MAG: ATP-binding protein [Planctomycetes bacterium]|nr:ATP-binding protein [Planctomycetota bacterium]
MKRCPLSVQTFSDIIEGGFLYVDETAWVHEIVSIPKGAFFISRPRRFGKSLLLSTFKAVFLGKRDLFQGLAIEKLPYDWRKHPVIHLDLSPKEISRASDLREFLSNEVGRIAGENGLKLETTAYDERFLELIRKVHEASGKVVVLVDEYDKPILGNIENADLIKEIQRILKAFYSVLKAADPYLRFVFLTGVSKFSKVSVFSDLNNLKDLSMDPEHAALLGYTEEELDAFFGEAIEALSVKEGRTLDATLEKIRGWYNGYRFSEAPVAVYNPVSVMSLLESGRFRNYWFETGTPSFLINLLKTGQVALAELPTMELSERAFAAYEVERLDALPLLYQTGYLTIANHDPGTRTYRLDYPNEEVRTSFSECLVESFSSLGQGQVESHLLRLRRALEAGDVARVMESLKVFFANIPYDIQLSNERYYQTIFYVVFLLLGHRVSAEERTAAGRIDAVVETGRQVFVFELKLHGTAEEALSQIHEKEYHEKYLGSGQEVTLVGAAFDPKTRNIGEWATRSVE